MLQLLHFGAQLLVVAEEGVARLPVALHQRMANKQLTAQQRIDGAVVDWRAATIGRPNSVTFSLAITAPCDFDQCGSL